MAGYGSGPSSPAAAETDVDECAALQRRLDAKRAEISQLQVMLKKAEDGKAAAHLAGLAGINTAQSQMAKLRSELAAVRKWMQDRTAADQNGENLPLDIAASDADEEKKTQQSAKQLQVRALRHELARWKHQVDIIEAKVPRQEDEIVRLKQELQHTLDILSSTQHAVKHHEVDREFQARTSQSEGDAPGMVKLHGGGHGCIEAHAERLVREKVEGKNIRLSGKAKRLSGVVAAQQLLIQRLEKQVLKEEQMLDQKDEQLHYQGTRVAQLKSIVRQHSDHHICKLLGVAAQQPNQRKTFQSTDSNMSGEMAESGSMSKLPPI